MRGFRLLFVAILLLTVTQLLQSADRPTQPPMAAAKAYSQLPLYFEANAGQTDAQARFVARGQGYALFLTPEEAILSLRDKDRGTDVLRLRLLGANASAQIAGRDMLPGYSNYFIGKDASKWRTKIPHYAKVEYSQVYPGVDLLYYGNQRTLEYDFVVAPGADPKAIAFQIEGSDKLDLNEQGDLVVHLPSGVLELHKPVVYQQTGGDRHEIASRYVLAADGRVSFAFDAYDNRQPLVIDPQLNYSTFLAGSAADAANGITLDATGSVYVVGQTSSVDFPTPGAYQGVNLGNDAFLTKFSPDGASLIFSTYLGGTDTTCGGDTAFGVSLNVTNEPFVAGRAFSTDFPVTGGGFQQTGGGCSGGVGGSGFVTRFSADGASVIWSTYLGGLTGGLPTSIQAIYVSPVNKNAYVTGYDRTGTLATPGAFQTSLDAAGDQGAYIAKFSIDGHKLLYCTYIRALTSGTTTGFGITVDRQQTAYITGSAATNNFPVTTGTFQTLYGGGVSDAFVAKVNSAGTALVFATYLGGNNPTFPEYGAQIFVDFSLTTYIVGSTGASNFKTSLNSFQRTYPGGDTSAFVVHLAADGAHTMYSTFLGGSQGSTGVGIGYSPLCKSNCDTIVYGGTSSTDFPLVNPMQTSGDLFVATMDGKGQTLVAYSTLFGATSGDTPTALAVDSKMNAFVTGTTSSASFPTSVGAFQPTFMGGATDAFVSKVGMSVDMTVNQTASPSPVPSGQNLTYTITITDNGPDTGMNVIFTDVIPVGTTFYSLVSSGSLPCVFPPVGGTGTARCTRVGLSPSDTWTVTLVVNVTAGSGSLIKNRASVSNLATDPNTTNNHKDVQTMVQ